MNARRGWVLATSVAALVGCAERPPAASPLPAPAARTPAAAEAAVTRPRYELSAASKRIASSLTGVLTIHAYVERGFPALDQFVDDLTSLLMEYERAAPSKVKVHVIRASTDEQRARARELGLTEQVLAEPGASEQSAIKGFLGVAFEYHQEKRAIPTLPFQESGGIEFWVTNKIRETRDVAEGTQRRIGVVTGHGEPGVGDDNLVPKQGGTAAPTIGGILKQAFPFYRLEEVDLRLGTMPIDPALVGIIVTQPQTDYREAELRRIDEYLMLGGKSLVVYASAVNLKQADHSMTATLSTRGLEALLDGYGIHMNRDAVFDHGAPLELPLLTSDGRQVFLRHPGIANPLSGAPKAGQQPLLDATFAGFFRMDEIVLPFCSSLDLMRGQQPADVRLEAVARSTAQASVETSINVDMKLREQWTPTPPQQQRILAAYAQGKLQSAFVGKPLPNQSAPQRAASASRVLVVSSSSFVTNPFAYAGNALPSGSPAADPQLLLVAQRYTAHLTNIILSVKNTLDWMSGDDDLVAASAKLLGVQRDEGAH